MKKSDILFALLRKSKILKEDIKTNNDRTFLISMKYQYSKLSSSLRNMIRIMATDIDRFEITGNIKSIEAVLENYHSSGQERPESGQSHPALVDNVSGNRFIIFRHDIKSNGVIVFKDEEHYAFIVACGCLFRAKERQDEILKQNAEEQKRLNILSEFL